jgi:Zn-dependent protease
LIPLLTIFLGGFVFGWAKPVPINTGALRPPKQGMRWVSAAGPAANLLMAFLWALILKVIQASAGESTAMLSFFSDMAWTGISLNLGLMALNLLPILPLDGGRILQTLLPSRYAWQYSQTEQYGMIVVLVLAATRVLEVLMLPLKYAGMAVISFLLGLR